MTGEAMNDMQFMYERDPLYFSADALTDWTKGDTDEIYAFKVVRAARYDALAALVRRFKELPIQDGDKKHDRLWDDAEKLVPHSQSDGGLKP